MVCVILYFWNLRQPLKTGCLCNPPFPSISHKMLIRIVHQQTIRLIPFKGVLGKFAWTILWGAKQPKQIHGDGIRFHKTTFFSAIKFPAFWFSPDVFPYCLNNSSNPPTVTTGVVGGVLWCHDAMEKAIGGSSVAWKKTDV